MCSLPIMPSAGCRAPTRIEKNTANRVQRTRNSRRTTPVGPAMQTKPIEGGNMWDQDGFWRYVNAMY